MITKPLPARMTRYAAAALSLGAFLILAPSGSAQSVVTRARIGGYAEDMTFVASGNLKDSIVLLEGTDLYRVPYPKKPKGDPATHLADLRKAGIDAQSRGIAYVESEGLFALNGDTGKRQRLFLVDSGGTLRDTRAVQYLGGYVPEHVEGLGYIPASSPSFADHLVMVAWDTLATGPTRILVLERGGQVVAEIFPAVPPGSDPLLGDVAYAGPNRLFVTNYSGEIMTVDFAGNVVSGPLQTPFLGYEGILQTSTGAVVALANPQSLLAFDGALNRVPANDRHDVIGLDLGVLRGVAWDGDSSQFLVQHDVGATRPAGVSAVPGSLASATTFVDLTADPFQNQIAYVPGEELVAVLHRAPPPRTIDLYARDGTLHSQVDLTPLGLGIPTAIEYVPTTDQFAVRFRNPSDPTEGTKLRFVSRAGALVNTIDMTCLGTLGIGDFAFFNPSHPSGGQLLMIVGFGRMMLVNLDGTHVTQFNTQLKFGLLQPVAVAAVTTGPDAGAFCVVDNYSGELVLFRLD